MAVYNLMQLLEVIFKTKRGILKIYSFDTCDKGEKVLFPCCIPAYGLGLQGSYSNGDFMHTSHTRSNQSSQGSQLIPAGDGP